MDSSQSKRDNPDCVDLGRRKALEKLGLGFSVAYVTPILLSLNPAAASGGGGAQVIIGRGRR